ncbi:DUF6415 family natural product biosynthesis protein [Streptomyces sp. Pv4-95]|uniref:DUF6415 family natural product biosynthesis protein n=1 Tax=Streptomyces sp. Pv4-95 TaxID=3049543 RepID=UPI003892307F
MSAVLPAALPVAADQIPIDVHTIDGTIVRAMSMSRERLDADRLAELDELLRGHIALLLPPIRETAAKLWHGGTAWYQQAARLDGIARQAETEISSTPFAALVQVQLLARDCQWLLNQHTGQK